MLKSLTAKNENVAQKSINDNGNDVVATILISLFFWHEREAFQQPAFGRLTAGNDVVATREYEKVK